MIQNSLAISSRNTALALALFLMQSTAVLSQSEGGVEYIDVAAESGITYQRVKSARDIPFEAFKQEGVVLPSETVVLMPSQPNGNPGVAIFDHDRDGDLDIYATNGPGAANSLYSNQLRESGELRFLDVGESSGAGAVSQDSAGVCFGDIDNDGDHDLYVTGTGGPNVLYENLGDGTFRDVTETSGTGGGDRTSVGCSFGDIDNDGYLDLVVANMYPFDTLLVAMDPDFAHLTEHNKLFRNRGDGTFEDVSVSSGIESILGMTWAVAMVDHDQDGDIDIFVVDDQAARASAEVGGTDFGTLRVFENDGHGVFTNVSKEAGTHHPSNWMGISFGDYNSDGHIDFFATNIGEYMWTLMGDALGVPGPASRYASRWYLGQDDGTFTRTEDTPATPFGWGTSSIDYDNDGDTDIIYHGNIDMITMVMADNPGVVLRNDTERGMTTPRFTYDTGALARSIDHNRRMTTGVATGDLDRDGFLDTVSISSQGWPDDAPTAPVLPFPLGTPIDDEAVLWPTFSPVDPDDPSAGFQWGGIATLAGTISVEVSDVTNGNNWAGVELVGSFGTTREGRVNRDGVGAVVSFKPGWGQIVTKPLVSGGSFASSDSYEMIFGMGDERRGIVEVLWPGGVRNRLYAVRPGERIVFPEIPCSFDDESLRFTEYVSCVVRALDELEDAGVLGPRKKIRFLVSAIRALGEPSLNGS